MEKVDFVVIMTKMPTIMTKRGEIHPVEAPVKTHIQFVFAIKVLPPGVKFPDTDEEEAFTNNLKKWCKRLIIADNAGAVVEAIEGCLHEIGLA